MSRPRAHNVGCTGASQQGSPTHSTERKQTKLGVDLAAPAARRAANPHNLLAHIEWLRALRAIGLPLALGRDVHQNHLFSEVITMEIVGNSWGLTRTRAFGRTFGATGGNGFLTWDHRPALPNKRLLFGG
jgi:hypothetical protein